jgi:DNA-binding CsgD family transcriptional regulator
VSAQAQTLWMLGRALVLAGDHDGAAAAFEQAAGLVRAADPGIAVRVLGDAAFSAMITGGPGRALPVAAQAKDLARSLGGDLQVEAEAGWGEIAVQAGDPAGIAAVEAAAPWLRPGQARGPGNPVVDPGNWGSVHSFAFAMILLERLAEAERAYTMLWASTDSASVPEAVAPLATVHSYLLARMGRLDEALESVSTALSLADLAPLIDSLAAETRAYIQLYRGDLDDSAYWCQRAEATATARGEWNPLTYIYDVRGHRLLQEGAAVGACEQYAQLEATVRRMGIGEPCMPPWPRHAISAYLAAGRTNDAERVLAWVEQAAERLPCRFPRIAVASGHAQLAELAGDNTGAEGHHQAAIVLHRQVDLPVEHAETLLAYGAFLRRSGRPAAARPVLTQASGVASKAGAALLAGLAQAELKVAGGRLRRRAPAGALSAQEERVAALAATGATNADIARRLSVSVSTIETHLGHIYTKLGIHTRYQLIAAAVHASWGAKQSGDSPMQR